MFAHRWLVVSAECQQIVVWFHPSFGEKKCQQFPVGAGVATLNRKREREKQKPGPYLVLVVLCNPRLPLLVDQQHKPDPHSPFFVAPRFHQKGYSGISEFTWEINFFFGRSQFCLSFIMADIYGDGEQQRIGV
jgi:hypothetical protein